MAQSPIYLSRMHFPVTTLGPGRRLCIWFQGCSIRCPGCISMDTWAEGRHETTVNDVLRSAEQWLSEADGVTISGGEPFDQPAALKELLAGLRSRFSGDILVYSGHPFESLALAPLNGLIDALMTDPFLLDRPQTLALRGSDNQRLNCLTPLGRLRFEQFEREVLPGEQILDIMFEGPSDEIFLAGIPARGDLKRLSLLLEEQGHAVHTTEDVREAE